MGFMGFETRADRLRQVDEFLRKNASYSPEVVAHVKEMAIQGSLFRKGGVSVSSAFGMAAEKVRREEREKEWVERLRKVEEFIDAACFDGIDPGSGSSESQVREMLKRTYETRARMDVKGLLYYPGLGSAPREPIESILEDLDVEIRRLTGLSTPEEHSQWLSEQKEFWRKYREGREDREDSPSKSENRKKGIPAGLRAKVLVRDNFTCQWCGRKSTEHGVVLHIDHKVPESKGGKTVRSNLQTLCEECNLGKGDRYSV